MSNTQTISPFKTTIMLYLPEGTIITTLTERERCVVIRFKDITRFTLAHMEKVKLDLIPLFVNKDYRFILDFEGFDFMDSSGIGCLILLSKSAKRHESQMKLCNIAPNVQEILEMLRIPMILEIEKDIESCIKNFKY